MDHLIFMDQPVQLVYIYISFTFAVVASVVHVGPHLQYLELGVSTRRAIKLESGYLQYAHVHTDAAPLAALCSEHCSNSVLWFDLRQLASAVVSEETCLGHPLQPFALSIAPTQCYGLI